MQGLFLNEETQSYANLSSDLILGINRTEDVDIDSKHQYRTIKLRVNESEDTSRKKYILKYINNNLYITSDLHLNHKNRNSGDFKNQIIDEINSKVPIDGAVLFLGDLGRKDDTNQREYITDFVKKLNCSIKILILGNHDILPIKDYYNMGFTFVTDVLETKYYVFSHYPIPISKNKINFHGHIHEDIEYWNVNPINHINCYIKNHNNSIYTLYDYIEFYRQGKYKDNKRVEMPKKKEE